ncbi:MAG: methyltransferase domain-containing protein [Actinobacteria bacterium]|uniref:Unannotated protein n=1 Tax=freshwater metagenome TaxID=449393 RepID=A0A6J6TGK1_9ZZZZ|nr:methyltransferase domain-containing protein [Actinomycetota bacterium]MSW76059.1 methyltransferase domain-containing protein [Actinomycetota bacterium]MSX54783.1 methyltransferase domain-containing protein [Actinomycetota bacterium]MSX93885.1 methyltransferase domain-containing protein [Actinomycetota bacterium]MSZ84637.1 methyltransferase domain-containing protein [Actinomycetota bacterium]
MAKSDEIAYLERMGQDGQLHALGKPWSDAERARLLGEVAALLSLLPQPPARVLDVGAGSGWTACILAMAGYSVVASDISPDMVSLIALNAERYRVELDDVVVSDFEALPFDNEFDIVVFYDCLHHSDDEVAALRGAHRALKVGGMCITLEPGVGHHTSPGSIVAMQQTGVTERDMPPRLIISAGRAVGFTAFEVYERPQHPIQLGAGRVPRVRTVLAQAVRFLKQATPFASTRGHFVVLRK